MKKSRESELVGKSFEELSVGEMNELQGASNPGEAQTYSSASVIVSISLTVASAGLSGQVSKAISTLVTAANNCA